jgi:hypothetical protein
MISTFGNSYDLTTCVTSTRCQEVFVASKKQRDAVINEFFVAGKVPTDARIADALGVSTTKYLTLSRIIMAAEPISIHESASARELSAKPGNLGFGATPGSAPASRPPPVLH